MENRVEETVLDTVTCDKGGYGLGPAKEDNKEHGKVPKDSMGLACDDRNA